LSREEKGDYDCQILLAIDGGKFRSGKPIIQFLGGQGQGTRDAEAKDSEIATKVVPGGYQLEARIARKNFFELGELKAGMEMRFDIGVDDADDPVQKRKTQIMWNASDGAVWNAPDLWGTAVLK
jgi:hypothetical protein